MAPHDLHNDFGPVLTLEGMLPSRMGLYWGGQSYRQMSGTPLPCRVQVASPTTPPSDSDRLWSQNNLARRLQEDGSLTLVTASAAFGAEPSDAPSTDGCH